MIRNGFYLTYPSAIHATALSCHIGKLLALLASKMCASRSPIDAEGRALSVHQRNQQISFEGIQRFLKGVFGQDLHAKRILSLAGATLGAIESGSLAVALIGQGLALARGLTTKYAIKQVDRMLANMAIDVDALLRHWVPL